MIRRFLPLTDNKGASSVLIILMMIVLIVFGLAALTTSMAAMRLTDKSADWTGEYYALEKEAGEFLLEMDGILYNAESEAISYIEEALYLNNEQTLFPDNIQDMIYNSYNYTIPESAKAEYLSRVMEAAFYETAVNVLLEEYPRARYSYSGGFLRQILEDEGLVEVIFSITISEKETEFAKNLDITVRLTAPKYYIELTDSKVLGERADNPIKRYKITAWKEWQEYFDYSEKIEFTDTFDQTP